MTDHPGDLDDTVVRPAAWAVRSAHARSEADTDDTVLSARPSGGAAQVTDRPGGPGASRPARVHSVRVGHLVHPLDVPVVIGRRPSAPRVPRGATPRLVAVASDGGIVSGSHLDVRQEGDVVVVTDLRSTNGTRVAQPGRPAVQLRQGESLTVLAGTTIDLGDAVLLEILPPQRLTLKDGPQP
ncbi:FHA domain-containing protein [Frigoribacterium salinisoli]